MKQYLELMQNVLTNGEERTDRTGTGVRSLFGAQMRFDLGKGFPLVTTKKTHLKSIIHELLWFLKGGTSIKYLNDNGVHIWDEWAGDGGYLGPVYGAQWRSWSDNYETTHDQIANVIKSIKNDPYGRRHIVSAWNVGAIDYMALPPCHVMFQFYVSMDGKLSCQLYQRSADIFLGVPFNIASYALLTMMIAQVCDLKLGEFIHTIGDAHIYNNHIEQCTEQLKRVPVKLPTMFINSHKKDIDSFVFDDFKLLGYASYPHIKGSISV